MPTFINDLKINQNKLVGAAFETLASAPSSPVAAQVYGALTTGIPMYWNPVTASWRPLDASGLTDGSIPIAGIANFQSTVLSYKLNQFAAPNGPVGFGGYEITNIAVGGSNTSATRLDQVNTLIANAVAGQKAIKDPVKVLVKTNVASLSGLGTYDSVTLVDGDAVALIGQTDATQNGIWVAHPGAWVRRADFSTGGQLEEGSTFLVNEGTVSAGSIYRLSTIGTITIGSSALAFQQVAQPNVYTPDNNTITFTGMQISVKIDAAGWLTYSASGLSVDKTKVVGKSQTILTITGDGTSKTWTLTHNLNNSLPIVTMTDASGNSVEPDWTVTSANAVAIKFGIAPANGVTYTVSAQG